MNHFPTTNLSNSNCPPEPIILQAVYFSEPGNSSNDGIPDEIATHGGEEVCSSQCRCCGRREIVAVFDDHTRALDAATALEANWDVEVEVHRFNKTPALPQTRHEDHAAAKIGPRLPRLGHDGLGGRLDRAEPDARGLGRDARPQYLGGEEFPRNPKRRGRDSQQYKGTTRTSL